MTYNDRDIILGWIGGFAFGVICAVIAVAVWILLK